MCSSKAKSLARVGLLAGLLFGVVAFYNARLIHFIQNTAVTPRSDLLQQPLSLRHGPHCTAVPPVRVKGLDCSSLFLPGDSEAKTKAAQITSSAATNLNVEQFLLEATRSTDYCETLWHDRCYINSPMTDEEASYPIAYSILMYKDVVQFERLLRAIYRPQNYYCVHVDKSSTELVYRAVRAIVNCFRNVFLASRTIDVKWGEFSVLEAELVCMKNLLAYKAWKYFINLTGQEFPLKTNLAIVRILKSFNGSNHIFSTRAVTNEHIKNAPPPPANVTLTMGSVHILATRAYVNFALNSQPARIFLQWVRRTRIPDETFFTTLNHSPQLGVPGAYTGRPLRGPRLPFVARHKIGTTGKLNCSGKVFRLICILGVGDLERLKDSKGLFANKFHFGFEPAAYDCMEEWVFNATRSDLEAGAKVIDTTFYEQLDHVRHHVTREGADSVT